MVTEWLACRNGHDQVVEARATLEPICCKGAHVPSRCSAEGVSVQLGHDTAGETRILGEECCEFHPTFECLLPRQGAGCIDSLESAADVVASVVAEAREAIAELGTS